ncbi:MAG: hypothetical protein ACLQT6_16440 [Desulfomonilaceae bacterium]
MYVPVELPGNSGETTRRFLGSDGLSSDRERLRKNLEDGKRET